jgi:lysophospholipase L1-like esterase
VHFRRLRRRLLAAVVVLAAALSVGLPTPAQSAPATPGIYVALGDSYAAGPIIPVPVKPWGCLKSSNNYAHMLASQYGFTLRDATCSGAETGDMTNPQGVDPDGPNPPQFDSLSADVSLVTLQIGGNDIGFGGIAETCAQQGFKQQSCESAYVKNGDDELRDRIAETAPKVAAVIQGIHALSPSAAVLVLGYPGIFKFGPTASCPAMLVGEGDAQYLRGIQEALNGMIADQAAANGATYVDVFTPSAGKTACDLPVLRWIEPIVPVNAAAPIHPNINGMAGMAGVVARAAGLPSGASGLPLP